MTGWSAAAGGQFYLAYIQSLSGSLLLSPLRLRKVVSQYPKFRVPAGLGCAPVRSIQ
jgi:hypothetical protein